VCGQSRSNHCEGGDEPSESPYRHRLQRGSIRLLRLLPDDDKNADIQCQLFDYPLGETGDGPSLYEALSYEWGSPAKPHSVFVSGGFPLPVTANLHAALSQLRDRHLARTLWVDAICINQDDLAEREQQVRLMPGIYYKANRVLVWLGDASDAGDQALNDVCASADDSSSSGTEFPPETKQAISLLLQRQWFRRMWVSLSPPLLGKAP
jgi:hypothetical protein